MIVKMTKYSFILLNSMRDEFLEELKSLGVIDITRSVKPVDDTSVKLLSEAEGIKKRISLIERDDFTRDEVYKELSDELNAAQKEYQRRLPWGEFDATQAKALAESGYGLHFFCEAEKNFQEEWAETEALTVINREKGYVYFVVAGSADDAASIPAKELPAIEGPASQMASRIAELNQQIAQKEAELSSEKSLIPELEGRYKDTLEQLDTYLASVQGETAAEDALCVFTGFAPSENDEQLFGSIEQMDGIFCLKEDATAEDNPPIKLKNNVFVRMFEVLTDMYGRPKYDGFDPTPFISIFFLLFFAMCIGDAGYGIVLVIVGILLKKVKNFKSLAPLVITLGAGTAVVGFFFHTFFSIDISKWACIPDGVKAVMVPAKIAGYDGAMVLALLVGIIHLLLAMIVKTVYATKNKGFGNSLSIWGWTLFWVGLVVIGVIALLGVIDTAAAKISIIVLGIICAIGIFPLNNLKRNPLVNIGSGLWDTYNMATGILGDVLSYLRLYALGLAGAMLGFAFNDLAKMALGDGGFGWVAFVLIALIGHTLNIAMAALGAFVHPLRLNFLEFFKNSNYDGNGLKYNPLKK